jgi:dihydroneopterin aldolase
MGIICSIKVKDLYFFSYHGFYPEEQILGNDYLVSISVTFPSTSSFEDSLDSTINYEDLYRIAKVEMEKPQKLLETVANNILTKTLLESVKAENIIVNICKINPPFGGDKAQSEVKLIWTRDQ